MEAKIRLALSPAALKQIDGLRAKLRETEETLSAIRAGDVDALVVDDPSGAKRIYTLKGADQPYRVLVENMNEGALTLSARGVILYCNKRMAFLAGRPLERMMGQKFTNFLVHGDAAVFAKLLRGAAGPRKAVVRLRAHRHGAHAQLSLTPFDLDGARAFSAIVTDLTEAFSMREALRQKEAGLRLVAQSAPAVLFTADSHGRVLSAAGSALKTIHGRVSGLLAASVAGAGARARATARSMRLRAVREGAASYDARYAGRLWNVSLERLGIGGVIGIAVDVTGERRELEHFHADSRERQQRDFIANVSHELRTPLAAIQGSAETLLGGALDNRKNARQFVQVIGRQTARLSELVENVLYLRVVEDGQEKPKSRSIPIASFMRDLLKGLSLLAAKRKVSVELSIPPAAEVFADADQLHRVFMCVASNAIVYNRSGGKVVISAAPAGDKMEFTVADTGIGIKASELPFVFDRFHRAKGARQLGIKGTGLGLSIAKMLVHNNSGQIWVESTFGKGSRFKIQLPARG